MTGWAVFCIAMLFSIAGCFDEGRVPSLASPETALAPETYLSPSYALCAGFLCVGAGWG